MIAGLSDDEARELALPATILRRLHAALDRERVLEAIKRSRAHTLFEATAIDDCSVDRVHFGSRLGYVVDYTLQLRVGRVASRVKAFGQVPFGDPYSECEAAKAKIAARLDAAHAQGRPQLQLLDSIGVILRAAGTDERIDWLTALTASTSRRPECRLLTSGELGRRWSDVHLLSHRLGKRAVLRLSGEGSDETEQASAILKLYKRKSTAAAHCAAISASVARQRGRAEAAVGIPRIFGLLDSAPGLLMEQAPGLPLHLIVGPARTAGHRSAGEALARFHASRIPGLELYGVADEVRVLQRWLAFASNLRPALVARLAPSVDRLTKDGPRCDTYTPVPIHRDFHDKQIIIAGDRSTLIDFDTVRLGDPAQDIGNFLAHIHLHAAHGLIKPAQTSEWIAFIDGYQSMTCSPSMLNIDWHRRASLLRLAMIRSFSDDSAHLAGVLARSADMAGDM